MAFVPTITPSSSRRCSIQPRCCSLATPASTSLASSAFLSSNDRPYSRFPPFHLKFDRKVSALKPCILSSASTTPSVVPKILISGAPASGKGTQCELLVSQFNVVHISTGDMLRSAVKDETELGKKAKEYMDAGELVPDDLIISLLLDRLDSDDVRERGWLLDGFPRTQVQAKALDESNIIPDSVIVLDVPDEVLIERVVGRRLDPETGKIYHVKYNPAEDKDVESRLITRSDDTAEKAEKRLANYYKHAQSIFDHYGTAKVKTINGNQQKQTVFDNVVQIIGSAQVDTETTPPLAVVPRILISGAPASGKGTQCELLVSNYNVVHISTGDMLRSAVKNQTDLGKKAKEYMDAGELVPDDLIISLLLDRLDSDDVRERGWLLDGFPRTEVQAKALDDSNIIPDSVIVLDVPDEILIDRVVGRRLDPETGKIYHVKYNPPKDKVVESRLTRRSDDTKEKAEKRLDDYYTHAQSIFDHYGSKKVKKINGNQQKQQVFEEIIQIIDSEEEDDDDDNSQDGGRSDDETKLSAVPSTSATVTGNSENSTKGLSVNEFVKRAEEAFETGVLETKDVDWSGQATLDDGSETGTSTYSDLVKRLDLVLGDTMSIFLFAYIGRANHGDASIDLGLLKTALPFLTAWFLTTPLLGAYTRAATADVKRAAQTFLKSWAVAVPMGIALRGVVTEHVPPMVFTAITLATTLVLTGAWRVGYVKVRGEEPAEGIRGGVFDTFRMVTTLLKRW